MITPDSALSIIREVVGSKVIPDDSIQVLGSDSLDLLHSIMEVERWTDVSVSPESLVEMKTVGDMVDYLVKHDYLSSRSLE